MRPPEHYVQAADYADGHIQLLIEHVSASAPLATVTGPVVRVFRGSHELLRRRVSLQLHYYVPGETHVRPGGIGLKPLAEIRVGRVVEALINTRADAIQIPLGLCMLLDAPTETPQYVLAPAEPASAGVGPTWLGVLAALVVAGLGLMLLLAG